MVNGHTYIEIKNKVGTGGADSFTEAGSYYINGIELKPYKICPVPALITEFIGPNLNISGAVFGEDIYIDRLASLWLVPQTQNGQAMMEIARVLAALRRATKSLCEYYSSLVVSTPTADPRQPAFNQHSIPSHSMVSLLELNMIMG